MFAHYVNPLGIADAGGLGDYGHIPFSLLLQQQYPEPAANLPREGGHDAQGWLAAFDQSIEQGDCFPGIAGEQGIAHLQGIGAQPVDQALHGCSADAIASSALGVQGEFLQFHREPGAVAADGIDEGIHSVGLQGQSELVSSALHQLPLTGAIPDGRQFEAEFFGLPCLHPFLQGLGGAQPAIGFGGVAEQQLGAVGDGVDGRFKAIGQLTGAGIAKG